MRNFRFPLTVNYCTNTGTYLIALALSAARECVESDVPAPASSDVRLTLTLSLTLGLSLSLSLTRARARSPVGRVLSRIFRRRNEPADEA